MKARKLSVICIFMLLFMIGYSGLTKLIFEIDTVQNSSFGLKKTDSELAEDMIQHFNDTTLIYTVMNDPVFGKYGRFLFPMEEWYMSGETLGDLQLTWYNNIDLDKTVEVVNTLWNRASAGQTVFYDIYTEEEKARDPDKEDTGLFFFKGNPGEKFAVCNAGGGFCLCGCHAGQFSSCVGTFQTRI